jgi:hypothetical protein
MEELASATSLVGIPLALVLGAVGPDHCTEAVSHATLPLTFIDCFCFVSVRFLNNCCRNL